MTILVIAGLIAAWALIAFFVLVVFGRMVSRADEENEVSSLRRTVRTQAASSSVSSS